MSQFKYKVIAFDEAAKHVDVEFENGEWARVPLTLPFPTTQEELDAVVMHYAPAQERVQAIASSAEPMAFIKSLIGKERWAKRREEQKLMTDEQARGLARLAAQEEGFGEPMTTAQVTEQQIRAVVEKVLAEKQFGVGKPTAPAQGGKGK